MAAAPNGGLPAGIRPLDVEEFRAHAHRMVDFIADYYSTIETYKVRSDVKPGYLRPLLPDHAPATGEPFEAILADVKAHVLPGVTHWQSPSFFAYYPANSSTAGFLGEMLSGALNVVGFSWVSSPAATELETIALDWLAQLLALPPAFHSVRSGGKGGGVIQGTASESVLVAMLAARGRALRAMGAGREGGPTTAEACNRLAVYTSDQGHSSVQKACMVAGVDAVRVLPTDGSTAWALDPAVLARAVEEDKAKGFVPFFIFATVGTTSTCAIDPLKALGAIAQEHAMWLHVDAAYAGSACVCPELRHYLDGVEGADSFNMNAHKWMLTNWDCSCLFLKESKHLVDALSISPEYLRNKATEAGLVVDYKDWQIPLGRRFRSLKLWFIMRMHGSEGLQAYYRSHIAMAARFEELVCADDRFELVVPRTLSLVCFRVRPPQGDPDNGRGLNATLLENLNVEGRLFFTHTVMSGVYTLRLAVGATLTEMRHVEAAWAAIEAEATKLLGAAPAGQAVSK